MKYIKSLGLFFISLLILNIIISIFSYFDLLNNNIISILKVLTLIISTFISGIYLGLKSDKKGYLEGLKLGLLIIIIFSIFNIILKGFNKYIIFYYLLIIILEVISSTIGINKKRKK